MKMPPAAIMMVLTTVSVTLVTTPLQIHLKLSAVMLTNVMVHLLMAPHQNKIVLITQLVKTPLVHTSATVILDGKAKMTAKLIPNVSMLMNAMPMHLFNMLATPMLLVTITMDHIIAIVMQVGTVNQMNSMLFAEMLMNVLVRPQMVSPLQPPVIPTQTAEIQ